VPVMPQVTAIKKTYKRQQNRSTAGIFYNITSHYPRYSVLSTFTTASFSVLILLEVLWTRKL
jgi:hypothetical protein